MNIISKVSHFQPIQVTLPHGAAFAHSDVPSPRNALTEIIKEKTNDHIFCLLDSNCYMSTTTAFIFESNVVPMLNKCDQNLIDFAFLSIL